MTAHHRHSATLLLALLAWLCLPTPAPAKTVIGVIMPGTPPYFLEVHKAFLEALKSEVSPAHDLEIIVQRPFPDAIAIGNATRKLVAAEADIIVTYGAAATLAVLSEKIRQPLLYSGVYDPANAPFVGRNLTGCGFKVPLSSLLRYLRELKPCDAINVLYCSLEDDSVRQVGELAELAKEQQLTLNLINIRSREELKRAPHPKGDALFITGSSVINMLFDEVLAMAKVAQQPSVSILPDLNEAGVTISLYNSPVEQGRKTAQLLAQILAGRPPREIKPETLRNTELVFNLREAKSIGVKIPFQLVAEASRVIK